MPSTSLQSATANSTSSQPALKSDQKPERKLKITPRVRDAIHNMVWLGLKRDEAATNAGIKDNSLYIALRRPDVKAYYLKELDVLRTSERARNIHTLAEVRDQTSNQMARVQAVKALEQISDEEQGNRTAQSSPGMVIVINNGPVPSVSGPHVNDIRAIEGRHD